MGMGGTSRQPWLNCGVTWRDRGRVSRRAPTGRIGRYRGRVGFAVLLWLTPAPTVVAHDRTAILTLVAGYGLLVATSGYVVAGSLPLLRAPTSARRRPTPGERSAKSRTSSS